MIADIIAIVRGLLKIAEAAMNSKPDVDTSEADAAIKRVDAKLERYEEARRILEG
jgi:hypothetical protein